MSKSVYLCGSIQASKDGGVAWREKITPKLEELGITVLSPTKWELEDFNGDMKLAQDTLQGWIRSGNWEKWDAYLDKIIKRDLDAVNECDILIVFIDTSLKIGGTIEELVRAIDQKKDIFIMCYDNWTEWNSWILRRCRQYAQLFDSWTSLLDAIEKKYDGRKKE